MEEVEYKVFTSNYNFSKLGSSDFCAVIYPTPHQRTNVAQGRF